MMIGPDTGYGYVFTSVWLPKAGIEVIHTKILKKAKIQIDVNNFQTTMNKKL